MTSDKARHIFDDTNRSLCNLAWWDGKQGKRFNCRLCRRIMIAEKRGRVR